MANYYNPKSKTRFLIPLTIILALIALALLTFSVYMSRSTRNVLDLDTLELVQLNDPQEGDPICIIHTSVGDISAVLYPEYAPNTVENFVNLAESGYYDNTFVYNIIEDTYFTAGSPNKSGTLDTNLDSGDEEIPLEYSQNLWPLKGAIYSVTTKVDKGFIKTLMNRATRYGGSRFGICNSIEMTDEIKENLTSESQKSDIANAFIEKGGIPNFSQQMTIFAQVYDGFDVIDDITGTSLEDETNYNGYYLPQEDIRILNIEISTYTVSE
jgi:peptidyl-prolyl cis-trans isomerase B (cyclophilin B)